MISDAVAAVAREPGGGVPGRVLLIDDEPLLLRALRRILAADGHRVEVAASVAEAEPFLQDPALDVVLVDLFIGATHGLEVLARVKRDRPEVEVLVMTGQASIESAVGCMRQGAFDYLAKPFDDVHRVRTTVKRALERRRLMHRNRELERELRVRDGIPELVGTSPVMRRLVRTIQELENNESHVLVLGESGTGKELVARAIHRFSRRSDGPFVPVDCGALPESIIESELFGHQRGAFTGAVGAPGLFRMAERGTLFLDEVGEIPGSIQAKLLRSLQHKEVRSLGSATSDPVDIRIVAATHRDLPALIRAGRFRMDLFYRLDVVRLEIPPLRQRPEDVPLLVQHFLQQFGGPESGIEGVETEALERLMAHAWPGNVRELENAIESAMAMTRGPRLRGADLRLEPARPVPGSRPAAAALGPVPLALSLEAYEKHALERALAEAGGDAVSAARVLGIGRSTLYRKLAKHGVGVRRAQRSTDEAGVGCAGSIG